MIRDECTAVHRLLGLWCCRHRLSVRVCTGTRYGMSSQNRLDWNSIDATGCYLVEPNCIAIPSRAVRVRGLDSVQSESSSDRLTWCSARVIGHQPLSRGRLIVCRPRTHESALFVFLDFVRSVRLVQDTQTRALQLRALRNRTYDENTVEDMLSP